MGASLATHYEAHATPGEVPEGGSDTGPAIVIGAYEHLDADILATIKEETIGYQETKMDRMFFEKFEDTVRENRSPLREEDQATLARLGEDKPALGEERLEWRSTASGTARAQP